MNKPITLLLLLFFLPLASSAEIYTWIDENGITQFSDTPPQETDATQLEIQINGYSAADSSPTRAINASKKVVMYSTSWCTHCKRARQYFTRKQIDFEEYDIEKSSAAKRRYDQLGGRGVPVITIGDKKLTGFSESLFNAAYF